MRGRDGRASPAAGSTGPEPEPGLNDPLRRRVHCRRRRGGLHMATAGSILGNAVLRLEDPTLLTGEGKYVDDLVEQGMLHVAFARSSVAHANLLSVDVSEASGMPGVVAVYHAGGEDLGLASLQQFPMMPETLNRPIFATGKVRFVGDIVAAVVAESRAQATDAAERIIADYEPLPPVMSAVDALAPDAPLLFADHGSNVCFGTSVPGRGWRRRPSRRRGDGRRGDHGEPAPRRRAHGDQRHRRGPRGRRPHLLGLPPGAALDPCRLRAHARSRAGSAAHRLPVGGRRLRPEGGAVRGAPRGRGGGIGAGPAREVGGDAARRTWCRSCTAATSS